MHILYITNGFPFPLMSGYLRHYFLIKGLSKNHTITLLSIVRPDFNPAYRSALVPYTDQIFTFTSSQKGRSSLEKGLKRLMATAGISPTEQAALEMKVKVWQLLQDGRYDLVLFSGKEAFPAIQGVKDPPVVVDICDATSTRVRGRMQHDHWSRLPFHLFDYLQVRRTEKQLLEQTSHAFFASRRDREASLGQNTNRSSIVPNGVDLDYWKRKTAERGAGSVIFTGGMHFAPNYDAAIYLIEEIFPQVRVEFPEARLLIVGRDPVPRLVKAGKAPGVMVTGMVGDMRPYLDQATVFAAPLRFGAGIQNKVLEALSMELPVIASPIAAEGLRTETGILPPLEIARDRDEFARKIIQALREWSADPSPCQEGRRFIQENFSWDESCRKVEEVFHSLVGKVPVGSAYA